MSSGSTAKIEGADTLAYQEALGNLREMLGRRPTESTLASLKDVYQKECNERIFAGDASEQRYAKSLLHFATKFGPRKGSLKKDYERFLDKGHQCPEDSPAKLSYSLAEFLRDLSSDYTFFAGIQRVTHPSLETVTLEAVAAQSKRIAQVLREKPMDSHDLLTLTRLVDLIKNIRTQSLGENLLMTIGWNEKGRPVLPYHFDHLVANAGEVDHDKWGEMLRRVFTGHKRVRVEPHDLGSEAGLGALTQNGREIIERIVRGALRLSADLFQTPDYNELIVLITVAMQSSPSTVDELLNRQIILPVDPSLDENVADLLNPEFITKQSRPAEIFHNVLSVLRIHSLLTLTSRGEIQFFSAFLHLLQLWQWRPHISVDILLHVAASEWSNPMRAKWIESMLDMLHGPAHLSWSLKNHLDTEEDPFATVRSLDEFWEQLSIFLDPKQQRRLAEMDDEDDGKNSGSAPATPANGGAAPVPSDPGMASASAPVTDFGELETRPGAAHLSGAVSLYARNASYRLEFLNALHAQNRGAQFYTNPFIISQGAATAFRPVAR